MLTFDLCPCSNHSNIFTLSDLKFVRSPVEVDGDVVVDISVSLPSDNDTNATDSIQLYVPAGVLEASLDDTDVKSHVKSKLGLTIGSVSALRGTPAPGPTKISTTKTDDDALSSAQVAGIAIGGSCTLIVLIMIIVHHYSA